MSAPQHSSAERPPRSILGVVGFIGGLTMLIALGLDALGWLASMEHQLGEVLAGHLGGESFAHQLPDPVRWGIALLMAFGMPLSMLACTGWCQRLILWVVATVVMFAWAPVLCLASYQPEVVLVVLVTLLAGGMALLCAGCRRCRGHELDFESHEAS